MKENIEIAKNLMMSVFFELDAWLIGAKSKGDTDFVYTIAGMKNRIAEAKEILCESSANCSGTSPSHSGRQCSPSKPSPVTDSAPSESVSVAATPAKLSWLNCSESVPNVPGYYPTRNKNTRYYSSRGFYSNGSKWRCDGDCASNSFDVHPDDVASHEYLPISPA